MTDDEAQGIYGTAIAPNITWMRKYAGTAQQLDYNGETYVVEVTKVDDEQ